MHRFLFALLVFAAFAFTGCQPKDPLDVKISASSPSDYNDWVGRHHPTLPLEVQQEFDRAFGKLMVDTGAKLGSTDTNKIQNWLCTRLHGKTIRSVILEGYQVEADSIRIRMVVTSDNIVRLVQSSGAPDLSTDQVQRYTSARTELEKAIETLRSRLSEIDAQVRRMSQGGR